MVGLKVSGCKSVTTGSLRSTVHFQPVMIQTTAARSMHSFAVDSFVIESVHDGNAVSSEVFSFRLQRRQNMKTS